MTSASTRSSETYVQQLLALNQAAVAITSELGHGTHVRITFAADRVIPI